MVEEVEVVSINKNLGKRVSFPTEPIWGPGVYFLYGEYDELLYIGKSSCLGSRIGDHVRYFQKHKGHKIMRIEYLPTESHKEAISLEKELVVHHMPPCNKLIYARTKGFRE